jgi:hypothetical protein
MTAPQKFGAAGRHIALRFRVARELDRLIIECGKSKVIVSDNGSELTVTP